MYVQTLAASAGAILRSDSDNRTFGPASSAAASSQRASRSALSMPAAFKVLEASIRSSRSKSGVAADTALMVSVRLHCLAGGDQGVHNLVQIALEHLVQSMEGQ